MKRASLFLLSILFTLGVAQAASVPTPQGDESANLVCPIAGALQSASESSEPIFLTGRACGVCSYSDCLGGMEGSPCTRRFGGTGVCTMAGRVCGDRTQSCSCF